MLVSRVLAGREGSRGAAQGMQPAVTAAAAHVWHLLPAAADHTRGCDVGAQEDTIQGRDALGALSWCRACVAAQLLC